MVMLPLHVLQKDLMDPEKLKAREAKFGKALLKVGGGKEPITSAEALEKRAKRFGLSTKPTGNDEARKKVRDLSEWGR